MGKKTKGMKPVCLKDLIGGQLYFMVKLNIDGLSVRTPFTILGVPRKRTMRRKSLFGGWEINIKTLPKTDFCDFYKCGSKLNLGEMLSYELGTFSVEDNGNTKLFRFTPKSYNTIVNLAEKQDVESFVSLTAQT